MAIVTYSKRDRLLMVAVLIVFSSVQFQKGVLPALKDAGGDFANYYSASRILIDGGSIEPAYHDLVWFQKRIDGYGFKNHIGSFIPHPPTTALLFIPLSYFNPLTAKQLWTVLNLALIFLCIYLLSRISGLDWLLTGVLFMSTGLGLISHFVNGQLYLLLLTSLLLGLYYHQRRRPVLAGFCIGSLVLVKYVGVFFLLYFLFSKQWKLVVSAAATILLVFLLTVSLTDFQTMVTYATTVLPRHLSGEIQNPFAFEFQSWNSLLRRFFVYDGLNNPEPVLSSTILFLLGKNLVFWGIAGTSLLVFFRIKNSNSESKEMVRLAGIPLVVLLLSPASAAYHMLILIVTIVFMSRLLLEKERKYEMLILVLVFIMINFPLHLKLIPLARGWLTPIAYSRLWLLMLFFVWSIYCLRDRISWRFKRPVLTASVLGALVFSTTAFGYGALKNNPRDDAVLLDVEDRELSQNSILIKSPDIGRENILVSNCEYLEPVYRLHLLEKGTWSNRGGSSFYNADLFSDDLTFLAETVKDGLNQVWIGSLGHQNARFLVRGDDPAWHPDGRFVYGYNGKTILSDTSLTRKIELSTAFGAHEFSFSPGGNLLAYCVREANKYSLRILNMISRKETILLESSGPITSPSWLQDGSDVVFGWNLSGNQDIWSLELEGCKTRRITFSPANDNDPVWDSLNKRIVFTSDRNRGLGFSTLYWIPFESLE